MRTVKILGIAGLLMLLGSCIPDKLDDCPPPENIQKDPNVDITVDMDTEVDSGQETEMP